MLQPVKVNYYFEHKRKLYRVTQVSCNIKNRHISASKNQNKILKKFLKDLGPQFFHVKFHDGLTICSATTYS